MKRILCSIGLIMLAFSLFADLIITRDEAGMVSKEIYADGSYAEVINDRVMSVWDFRNMTLMLINYDLKIYTKIDYDNFRIQMERQTDAEIKNEMRNTDEQKRTLSAKATRGLFSRLAPRMEVVDSTMIAGYKSVQYKVSNDTLIAQRLWVSKDLKNSIAKEIPFDSMKKVENIFKHNRKMRLDAMNIPLDGITQLVELIEGNGYVMKRFDYGIRTKSNPKIYATVEAVNNQISNVSNMKVDPKIFGAPTGFKKLPYSKYQLQVIKHAENE